MMARYEKPTIEFEEYSLDTAIAACSTKISLGPEYGDIEACDEYIFVQSIEDQAQIMTTEGLWYEGSCSCYLSAGDGTLITS